MSKKSKIKKRKSSFKDWIACYEDPCPDGDERMIRARSLKEANKKAKKLAKTDPDLMGLYLSSVEAYNQL